MINVNNVLLLQEIRAIQALSETDHVVNIESSDVIKFARLKQFFNMSFISENKKGIDYTELIKTEHSKPLTSILSVSKPIIFPRAIANHLKDNWPEQRNRKISFSGKITNNRKTTLENWIKVSQDINVEIEVEGFLSRIKRKFLYLFGVNEFIFEQYGSLYVSSSTRGRFFPIKSWDDEYFDFMLSSEFVLCPSGDFIWTYRFFEAILSGAIPVVEETCDSYNGFKFFYMDDDISKLEWSKEIVEFNYELCLERITLSDTELSKLSDEITEFINNKKN